MGAGLFAPFPTDRHLRPNLQLPFWKNRHTRGPEEAYPDDPDAYPEEPDEAAAVELPALALAAEAEAASWLNSQFSLRQRPRRKNWQTRVDRRDMEGGGRRRC